MRRLVISCANSRVIVKLTERFSHDTTLLLPTDGIFAAGGYLGIYPLVVAQAFPKQYASALGLIFFWCFPGGLTGPVISGALFDLNSTYSADGVRTTNYLPLMMFGGVMMLAAGSVAVVEMLVLGREAGMKEGKRWKIV